MVTETTIPKGYRKTDVGVIPDDWEVKKLGDFVKITSGESPAKFKLCNEGIPYFKVDQLNAGNKYQEETPYYIRNHLAVPKKSLIFPKRGASILLNKIKILCKDSFMDTNLMTLTVSEEIDNEFLYYALLHFGLWRIADITSIPQINNKHINPLQIQFPPTKSEQTAIASVISDADTLVSRLEELIVKKRNIKQGALQELLTGKKRLPGFSGKWEVKKLGEIGEITGSGVDKKIRLDETPVRLVNYLDVYRRNFIYSKHLNHWVTAPNHQLVRCAVKKGDIFFTPSSEMPFDIGISSVAMEDMPDATYSYHVDRLRPNEDWDLFFRAYIFKTRFFLDQAEKFCEGSGKRYVISLTTFRERLTIRYPTDKKEQAAIAQVLYDMDAEIDNLEQKLDKYKMIKHGMMQELLTGKTRLI